MLVSQYVEDKIKKILSKYETGNTDIRHDAVYVYADGLNKRKQVTLSYGFTEDGGNLIKLLRVYFVLNGKYSALLSPFAEKIGKGVLWDSKPFIELLKEAAQKDPFFCDCQDFCFEALYLNRGQDKAVEYGIKTHLGIAVITDSVLHGSLDTVAASFPEARPSRGGDEKIFIKAYLNARRKWLILRGGDLANSVYRVDGFLDAISKDNWDLTQPFIANGTKID